MGHAQDVASRVLRCALGEFAIAILTKKLQELEDETVDAFTLRVTAMVNMIHGLGEKLEDIYVVRRFRRAAPPRYMPIVSAIEQCVDLETLTLDDLIGRFKPHDE